MTVSPPFRFLVVVLGGWVGVRAALIGSAWLEDRPGLSATAAAPAAPARPAFARAEARPLPVAPVSVAVIASAAERHERPHPLAFVAFAGERPENPIIRPVIQAALPASSLSQTPAVLPAFVAVTDVHPLPTRAPLPTALAKGASRWSASAWVFGRTGGPAGLAPGGTLGGSQAGARIAYRLSGDSARPLAASFRAYAPLQRLRGAEGAVGLDWKPMARLPVHLLVERRQALGEEGRSAFAVMAYGGISEISAGAFGIEAYGQAGVVGARSRDLFADGSARISLPVARVKLGAGVWAAVQPGVSRVDVGPQASVRLPGDVTLAIDWRLRVAGDAAPRSGPAVTLSTDF